jgi:hypothetical protein
MSGGQTVNASEERVRQRERAVASAMVKALLTDVEAFHTLADNERVTKFDRYKTVRQQYKKIQQLINQLQSRASSSGELVSAQDAALIMRQKISALRSFTSISVFFFRNAPPTVTQALGARELLMDEQKLYKSAHEYFDMMLFEAGIDDQTADALEETRLQIEEIITMVDRLLARSPKELEEF